MLGKEWKSFSIFYCGETNGSFRCSKADDAEFGSYPARSVVCGCAVQGSVEVPERQRARTDRLVDHERLF